METYSLRCKLCNGVMAVDKTKNVVSCPYCGSKELIVESDAVKIEEIRANAFIEKQKLDMHYKEKENEKYKNSFKSGIILLAILPFLFLIYRLLFEMLF